MSFPKWAPAIVLVLSFTTCAEPAQQATNPIVADVTSCQQPGEHEELIGSALYSDGDIQPGEYFVLIRQGVDEGVWSMFYRTGPGKAPWGGLTSQRSNSATQTEGHDLDGDGDGEWPDCVLEAHVLPNGVYDITFERGAQILFERTVAMLDRHGVAVNIPGSGAYQDLVVPFDVAPITPNMTVGFGNWGFGASTAYTDISDAGVGLAQFSDAAFNIQSGDTAWFASTYVPTDTGTGTRPWFGEGRAVLNAFYFDYDRNPTALSPGTNSFPAPNNHFPVAHVFAAPGASSVFTVRLRTVLPSHSAPEAGILVPQTMSVTVLGTAVTFTTSANPLTNQPVTFTAATLSGEAFFEYSWDFGDGATSGWSPGYKQIQHTYAGAGQKTVTLSVRNALGEGPTVSTTQNVTVNDPPLGVSIRGLYANQNNPVRQNQSECTWRADPTGGTGTYTYTWYQNGVQVGTTRFLSISVGTQGFLLKVVVQSGSQSVEATKSISVTANGQFCL